MPLEKQIIDIPLGQGMDTETDYLQGTRLQTVEGMYISQTGMLRSTAAHSTLPTDEVLRKSTTAVATRALSTVGALYGDAQTPEPLLLAKDDEASPTGGWHLLELLESIGWKHAAHMSHASYSVTPVTRVHAPISSTSASHPYNQVAVTSAGGYTAIAYTLGQSGAGNYKPRLTVIDANGVVVIRDIDIGQGKDAAGLHAFPLSVNGSDYFLVVLHAAGDGTTMKVTYFATSSRTTTSTTLAGVSPTIGDWDACVSPSATVFYVFAGTGGGITPTLYRYSFNGSTFTLDGSAVSTGAAAANMTVGCFTAPSATTKVFTASWPADIRINTHTHAASPTFIAGNNIYGGAATGVLAISMARAANYDSFGPTSGGNVVVAVSQDVTGTGPSSNTRFDLVDFTGALIAGSAGAETNLTNIRRYNTRLVARGFAHDNVPYFVMTPYDNGVFAAAPEYTETTSPISPTYVLVSVRSNYRGDTFTLWDPHVDGVMLTREAEAPLSYVSGVGIGGTRLALFDLQVSTNTVYMGGLRMRKLDGVRPVFALSDVVLLKMDFADPTSQSAPLVMQPAARVGRSLMTPGMWPQIHTGRVSELGFVQRPTVHSVAAAGAGGSMNSSQPYSYVAVFEWHGPDGRLHRSAPSNAKSVSMGAGDTKTTVVVETTGLCATETKVDDVYIVLYRTEGPGSVYYRVQAAANVTTAGTVSFTDITGDTDLITHEALYVNGGELDADSPRAMSYVVNRGDRLFYLSPDHPTRVFYSKPLTSGLAPEFSDALYVELEGYGDLQALGLIDDIVVALGQDGLGYFAGNGPNALGLGEFSPPRRISSPTGCNNRGGVVSYPNGLLFKTPLGIYGLNRALQIDPVVGAPARAFDFGTVSSAIRRPDKPIIEFMLGTYGPPIWYDYLHNAWTSESRFYPAHCATTTSRGPVLSVPGTGIIREDILGVVTATGTPRIGTNWIVLPPTSQGEQRVYQFELLGDLSAPLTIQIYKDFEGTPVQTVTYSALSGRTQLRVKPQVERCEAIKLLISRTSGTTFTSFSKLTLLMGVRPDRLRGLSTAASS